jgi:putative mycofactocin binding protein MftB
MGLVATPEFVKYRREDGFGLVYTHENYGYEDASLYEVDETVVEVLEFVGGGQPRDAVEAEFSPAVVAALLERGVLARAE